MMDRFITQPLFEKNSILLDCKIIAKVCTMSIQKLFQHLLNQLSFLLPASPQITQTMSISGVCYKNVDNSSTKHLVKLCI